MSWCLVINNEHFHGKIMQKMCIKASHRPLFSFGKQPKTAIACKKCFWKYGNLKEDYQKAFKKLTWFFALPPAPFYGQDYEKQKVSGISY